MFYKAGTTLQIEIYPRTLFLLSLLFFYYTSAYFSVYMTLNFANVYDHVSTLRYKYLSKNPSENSRVDALA